MSIAFKLHYRVSKEEVAEAVVSMVESHRNTLSTGLYLCKTSDTTYQLGRGNNWWLSTEDDDVSEDQAIWYLTTRYATPEQLKAVVTILEMRDLIIKE